MNTLQPYLGVFLVFLFSIVVGLIFIGLTTILGPKKPNAVKNEPFECGESPITLPEGRFSIKFYIIAMLFIVFDVELVFLFPWAVRFRELGWFGFVEMSIFLGILILGFVYCWRKGALEWE